MPQEAQREYRSASGRSGSATHCLNRTQLYSTAGQVSSGTRQSEEDAPPGRLYKANPLSACSAVSVQAEANPLLPVCR